MFSRAALSCGLLACAISAWSQETTTPGEAEPSSGKSHWLSIRPMVIDATNNGGLVLGLEYELRKNYSKKVLSGDSGSATFNPDAGRQDYGLEVKGKGTIATEKRKNPHKMADIGASFSYMHRQGPLFASLGGQAKFETDQSLDNKQYAFGLLGTATYLLQNMSFVGLDVGISRVDPSTDAGRKAALGGVSLDHFKRWEAELFYKYPLSGAGNLISDIELNYRYYKELSPPAGVRAQGLDRYRLALIRLNLKDDLFVQYASGTLPFDTKKERAVKFGWDYKIK